MSNEASLDLEPDRRSTLENSLREQGSNLIPLLVRRVEPDDDDREYEVIFGVDWFIVAEDLGIDRLWVWVFDLDPEQAEVAYEEMQRLTQSEMPAITPISSSPTPQTISPSLTEIDALIDRKLMKIIEALPSSSNSDQSDQRIRELIDNRLDSITEVIAQLPTSEFISESVSAAISQSPRESDETLGQALNRLIDECSAGKIEATLTLKARTLVPDLNAQLLRQLYSPWKVTDLRKQLKAMNGTVNSKAKKDEVIEALIELHREQG